MGIFVLLRRLTSVIVKLLNINELQPNGNISFKLDHLKALCRMEYERFIRFFILNSEGNSVDICKKYEDQYECNMNWNVQICV